MINVVFVCHGNICRSPMAEYLFKDMVNKKNVSNLFHIESRATSYEEVGNKIHYKTKQILDNLNIDSKNHIAKRFSLEDYNKFDYIIIMDEENKYYLNKMVNDKYNKIKPLLSYANIKRDISDPWYTGDFITTYNDIMKGLNAFYDYLLNNNIIKC